MKDQSEIKKLFEEFKRDVIEFQSTGISYNERVGEPDEFNAVIGRISINFQRLDDVLSTFIIKMLDLDIQKGKIVVAELSFNNKVNLFSSLFHLQKDTKTFNCGVFKPSAYFAELRKAIITCQELRNQIIHSSLLQNFKTDFKIIRQKITAKSKNGLMEKTEEINIPYLFDIADYIVHISMEIEHMFLTYDNNSFKEGDMNNRNELSDFLKYRV